MEMFLPCLYGFLACAAFSCVQELRCWRYIVGAAFTGAVGWFVYLLLADMSSAWRFLLATIVAATLAEIFARVFKTPATVFLIIGIVPMVPGGGIYYTMEALINGNMVLFGQNALATVTSAGAIAVGCSLVSAVARMISNKPKKRKSV